MTLVSVYSTVVQCHYTCPLLGPSSAAQAAH